MARFLCTRCGQQHELPTGMGASAPDYWEELSEEERKTGCILDEETCVIKENFFFIKGALDLPIQNQEDFFTFTVWVSLGKPDFDKMVALWSNPLREREPPYFGWLSTQLPGYPETINLKTNVFTNQIGVRPSVIVEPTNHPLAVDQRKGITIEHIQAITEMLIHAEDEE